MLRKMKWQIFFFNIVSMTILIIFSTPLFPQSGTSSNDGTAMTEQQVIELALKYCRKLQSLSTNVEIANYRLNSSGWIRNPELRLSDISTHYYTEEFDELRVGLRFRLPKLGELGEEKQQARVELWDRRVQENRYRQEFIARVRKDYANVLMYDQLAELAQKRVAKADERIRIIEQLVELGSRSVVYFTKAKMWHAESKNDLSRALQNQGLARRKLAKRTSIAENTSLILEDLPEVTQDQDELIKLAIEKRPEIELVQQRIELANKQQKFEYLKLVPWFNFIDISYHVEQDRNRDWGEFMAGINLPLFNWNIGNIKATHLAVKKKEDESDIPPSGISGTDENEPKTDTPPQVPVPPKEITMDDVIEQTIKHGEKIGHKFETPEAAKKWAQRYLDNYIERERFKRGVPVCCIICGKSKSDKQTGPLRRHVMTPEGQTYRHENCR